jgi:hypothetical protein
MNWQNLSIIFNCCINSLVFWWFVIALFIAAMATAGDPVFKESEVK